MNEESDFVAPEWDDESWELYRSGYSLTGEFKRERTQRLMDCWGSPHPYNTEWHRKLREEMKGPFVEKFI